MSKANLDTRFVWYKPETAFVWCKTKGGYQLQWPREKKGGYLVPHRPPLSLFRIFAALRSHSGAGFASRPVSNHILDFANKYGEILAIPGGGKLGGGEYYKLDETAISKRRIVRPYASLSVWIHQIRQMRRAVGLWDQCQNERMGKAARQKATQELQI